MLRVGLTGGLGSGKSTAAAMFARLGAVALSSDDLGRELMQPGQSVYRAIVERFGAGVVGADGTLDRAALARLAFAGGEDLEALNAIVHPAVIARQEELVRALPADSIVIVESALIFETQYGGGWRERFDRMVMVTAPEAVKIERFVKRAGGTAETRAGLETEARRRLALQMPDAAKMGMCDFVLVNDGDLGQLESQVEETLEELRSFGKGRYLAGK